MKRRSIYAALLWLSGSLSPAPAEAIAHSVAAPPAFALPDRTLFGEGRYIYERNCIVCHGERGDGQGEMAPTLPTKPRDFRTGLFKYRSTPTGKLPTTDDLIRTIRHGRTGTAMGAFTHLSNDETRAVAEYVKSFSRRWRKEENYAAPVEIPNEPKWLQQSTERTQHAVEGRKLFLATCATCHGERGDGKGPAAAAFQDVAGQPASPADLRERHLRNGDEARDVYRVLMTGLDGTPMASFADAMTPAQKWDLIAYLLTLRQ